MSQENNLAYMAVHLEKSGNRAMPDVLQMIRDSKLSELCYAYKIRTKPEKKLIEKVGRKQQSKPKYGLSDITDVVGLRLVALFRAEMVDIFEGVLSAITHANGISPNPFVKDGVEEVIIYKGTNAFDDLPPRLRDIATRFYPGTMVREEHSREGYSSVHIVCRLNIAPDTLPCQNYKVPIEIQIRSVFEDAWGEIDHKYGYVIRSGKDAGRPIGNPEFVLAHLKVLKRFSDACMEYADSIRTEAIGVPPSLLAPRKVISVASDNHILDRYKELGISQANIDRYRAARDAKDEASILMEADLMNGRRKYIAAAELFREFGEDLASETQSPMDSYPATVLYYYLRMNEALCLMSTNERDQVIAALKIYNELDSVYANYPLLKMRYGQALGRLGHIDDAILKLRESGEAAEKIAADHNNKPQGAWPDFLPLTDYQHLIRTQPKLLGYHLWLKIRSMGPDMGAEKGHLFKDAYHVTYRGLAAVAGDLKQTLSLHNNLLYYAMGQLTRAEKGSSEWGDLRNAVVKHVAYIEKHGPSRQKFSVSVADTMMKAYSVLGQRADAEAVANILTGLCLGGGANEFDAEEVLGFLKTAHQVLQHGDIGVID